jgi:branched-chain amino acid transport system ATP-binding protein
MSPNKIRALGIARVFQNIRLYSDMSVLDNVALGMATDLASWRGVGRASLGTIFGGRRQGRLWRRARARAEELLQDNGLAPVAQTAAGQLSYGVAKIVEILRAIAEQPRILLLDEPTSGVADVDAQNLRERLMGWQAEIGCAIVVVEHRIGWLRGLANRAYVLDGGVRISEGSVDEVLRDSKVVEAFVGG